MMRKTGLPPKNIVMAVPGQIKWVSIASLLIWSTSSPIEATDSLSALAMWVDLVDSIVPWCRASCLFLHLKGHGDAVHKLFAVVWLTSLPFLKKSEGSKVLICSICLTNLQPCRSAWKKGKNQWLWARDGNLKLVWFIFGNFCNDEGLLAVVFLLGCCCCVKNCLCRMKIKCQSLVLWFLVSRCYWCKHLVKIKGNIIRMLDVDTKEIIHSIVPPQFSSSIFSLFL